MDAIETPKTEKIYDISQYEARYGGVIAGDGKLYNTVDLMKSIIESLKGGSSGSSVNALSEKVDEIIKLLTITRL